MGILGSLLGGGISEVINSASGLAKIFVGDKSVREDNTHSEQIAAYDALAAEASAQTRENRTSWDSFVDGINRLVRPTLAFGIIGILVWCPINPASFANAMLSYQLVPEWLAIGFAQVLALFMGGRMLKDWKMGSVDPKVTAQVLDTLARTKAQSLSSPQKSENVGMGQSQVEPLSSARPIAPAEYEKQMSDQSRPLSLDAIVEWNKRRALK